MLEWLVEQKESSTIEEVTDEILDDLVKEHGYVAVYYSELADCGSHSFWTLFFR